MRGILEKSGARIGMDEISFEEQLISKTTMREMVLNSFFFFFFTFD